MYSNARFFCSSEIVQQTIDYGTAVRSSISKRSGNSTDIPQAFQPLASSVAQSCPSLVVDRSAWCPCPVCPVQYDDTSTYSQQSSSSGDHTSDEMSKETMTSIPCSQFVCNVASKNEKKAPKPARVVALRRMFVRRWDLIKQSTTRRTRNTSVTSQDTKVSCEKPVHNEIGTELNTKIAVATFTSHIFKNRRDAAVATSGLSVKKKICRSVDTSISDMKQLIPAPSVYHAGAHITKSQFSDKDQWPSSLRPKVDCTVMTGTNTPGHPPFCPTQLSRGVEPRKSNLEHQLLFSPSKWADIVVQKIMKNIPMNSQKKLTIESRGTTMTPNNTRSVYSSLLPNHGLRITSSKCNRDCNTSTFMGLDNSGLPFCPSDLAEKVAKKIISHITQKPTGYKLVGWAANECFADVATECGQIGPEQLCQSSVPMQKNVSQRSSESMKLFKCTIPEEDTDCEKLQPKPETAEKNSHSTNDDLNENTVIGKETECHTPQLSEQEPKSASAGFSENCHSSKHSTNLNITVTKNDPNLRRKPFRLSKQALMSCFGGQPSEESLPPRSKSVPKLNMNSENNPDIINFQQIKALNLWPVYSEGSTIARCSMLNTGTAQHDYGDAIEQLATQISSEVEKLKAFSLQYSDLKRLHNGNKTSLNPTSPFNEFLITITENEGNNEIVGRFNKETCPNGSNATAEQVTFTITACVQPKKSDKRMKEIVKKSKSCCKCTKPPKENMKVPKEKIHTSACKKRHTAQEITMETSLSKIKCPTEDTKAPLTTEVPPITEVPTKDETTDPVEAEKPQKLSCVRYISNLFSKKVKGMFEETPFQVFLRGMNADTEERDNICCQTSRIDKPRAGLKPSVQVNRVLVTLPEANCYKHLPNTISIWRTALSTTRKREHSETSCESSHTLCVGQRVKHDSDSNYDCPQTWCVRVGQSRVNHVFSVTNICSGKEMEKLRLAYFLLTAMEGRVRRVNINRLCS